MEPKIEEDTITTVAASENAVALQKVTQAEDLLPAKISEPESVDGPDGAQHPDDREDWPNIFEKEPEEQEGAPLVATGTGTVGNQLAADCGVVTRRKDRHHHKRKHRHDESDSVHTSDRHHRHARHRSKRRRGEDDFGDGIRRKSEMLDRRALVPKRGSKGPKRWEMPEIPEEELTVWELVQKNTRKLTKDELADIAKKKGAGEDDEQRKVALQKRLGGEEASSDLLDLFGGSTTVGSSSMVPESAGGDRDLFDDFGDSMKMSVDNQGNIQMGDFGMSSEADPFGGFGGLMESRSVITESVGSVLPPYKDAYKYTKPSKWTNEELRILFDGMKLYGLDTVLVKSLLPNKTQRQVSMKFKQESKKNPNLITDLIEQKQTLTSEQYEKEHGPVPLNKDFALGLDEVVPQLADAESTTAALEEMFGM